MVGDTALMVAILDPLLHHGEVFYLRGQSHRLRGKEPLVLRVVTEQEVTGCHHSSQALLVRYRMPVFKDLGHFW